MIWGPFLVLWAILVIQAHLKSFWSVLFGSFWLVGIIWSGSLYFTFWIIFDICSNFVAFGHSDSDLGHFKFWESFDAHLNYFGNFDCSFYYLF